MTLFPPSPVVPSPPSITEDPQNVTVPFAGGQASLSCSFTAQPSPSVVWLQDGSEVSPREGLSISSDADSTTLSLTSVSQRDVGSYQCQLSNTLGRVTSQTAHLVLASEYAIHTHMYIRSTEDSYILGLSVNCWELVHAQ